MRLDTTTTGEATMLKCIHCGEVMGEFKRDNKRRHMVSKHPDVPIGKTLKQHFSIVYSAGKGLPAKQVIETLLKGEHPQFEPMVIHEVTPDGKHYIVECENTQLPIDVEGQRLKRIQELTTGEEA
jgi:hypothetical protein